MSGLSLAEQLAQMSTQAAAMKKTTENNAEKNDKNLKKARRKSRDLEQDFFGMFLNEAKDIEEVFKKFDKDNSQTIDKQELKEALSQIKGAAPDDLTDGGADKPFGVLIKHYADMPKDAELKVELSLQAFKNLVTAIKNKDYPDEVKKAMADIEKENEAKAKAAEEELEAIFDMVDADGNKSISEDELKKGFEKCNLTPSDAQWTAIMSQANAEKEFSFDAFEKVVNGMRDGSLG